MLHRVFIASTALAMLLATTFTDDAFARGTGLAQYLLAPESRAGELDPRLTLDRLRAKVINPPRRRVATCGR